MTKIDNLYVYRKVYDLVKERIHWEQNEFLASNKVLYELLAKCMSLAAEIAESRKLQNQLDAVLSNYGVRLTSGTPLITKVINLGFGADRRRASAYSLAVREDCSGCQSQGQCAVRHERSREIASRPQAQHLESQAARSGRRQQSSRP